MLSLLHGENAAALPPVRGIVDTVHTHVAPRGDGPVGDAKAHSFAVGARPKRETHRSSDRDDESGHEYVQDLFGVATLDQNGAVRAGNNDADVPGTPSRLELMGQLRLERGKRRGRLAGQLRLERGKRRGRLKHPVAGKKA